MIPLIIACYNCGESATITGESDPYYHYHVSGECLKETPLRSIVQKEIEITEVLGNADLPAFLSLAHRHFQKSMPTLADTKGATLTLSVDLLDLLIPEKILDNIESIEVVYRKES